MPILSSEVLPINRSHFPLFTFYYIFFTRIIFSEKSFHLLHCVLHFLHTSRISSLFSQHSYKKMAGTNEPNPVIQKTSSSKKNKSKSGKSTHRHSGKSGHHEEQHEELHERQEGSGQSRGQGEDVQGQPGTSGRIEQAVGSEQERDAQGKGKKKKVHFSEEPSSKDRKSTRLNSSHSGESRMPSSA